MIIEMMHPRAEKALHNLWTSVCSMLTCFETHVTCIVLLALLRFEICSVFGNFAEACVMSVCLTDYAVSWCRWSFFA